MYLACHHGVLRRQHHFIDHDTHSAIPFRSQPQSQELRNPINQWSWRHLSLGFEDPRPLPVLHTFRSSFGWSVTQTLWPLCRWEDYNYLMLSVYETTDHCLKSNVHDMLSAATSLDSYMLTICPGHVWIDSYLLQSTTRCELCLSELLSLKYRPKENLMVHRNKTEIHVWQLLSKENNDYTKKNSMGHQQSALRVTSTKASNIGAHKQVSLCSIRIRQKRRESDRLRVR